MTGRVPTIRLGDIAGYSIDRINCSQLTTENYVGTDNILQNRAGKVNSQYVPTAGAATKYQYGDILVANIRPYLQKIWFADGVGGSSADVSTIRLTSQKFNPKFVYYNIFQETFFDYAMKGAKGSKMPRLDKGQVLDFTIAAFEESEQIAIAKILSAIDDKIALNNKINAELEQTARLIYDYWFTQFDFPDAQGKPYKSSGGAMVYNDQLKREIPTGWMDARIKDFNVDIITGKTPSTKDSSNFGGDIPFITIDDIRGNPFVISTSKTLTEKGAGLQANKFLPKGSLCVTCIATPGLVGFTAKMSQTNQQINTIVFHSEESKYYLYFGISDHFKYSAGAKTGNTFANMNKGDFENILLSKPPVALIETYHNAVTPLFNMIHQNLNETHELIQLRDWLLPMLMTGQVRVV